MAGERKPADAEPDEADFKTADEPGEDEPLGRDERVSLWPLSFEEVVRALHKTPAHRRGHPEPPEGESAED